MLQITSADKKILKEIINIGIAKAADSFATISKEEVHIDVPELSIIHQKDLLREVDPKKEVQIVIQSAIKGDISGQTLLFFYEKQLELLEKVCLNYNFTKGKIKNLKTSLVSELSNIITGALVTQLANLLKLNIFGSVPEAPIYPSKKNFKTLSLGSDVSSTWVVTIKTSFVKSGRLISLPFVIIFDFLNMEKILNIIRNKNFQKYYPG